MNDVREMDEAVSHMFDTWARLRHRAIGFHAVIVVRDASGVLVCVPIGAGDVPAVYGALAAEVELLLQVSGQKDARDGAGGEGLRAQARKPRNKE
jgi:hypothetical protein